MKFIIPSLLMSLICILICMTSCTISFQNIQTEGTASDLVDENQTASPDVKTDLTVPVKGL